MPTQPIPQMLERLRTAFPPLECHAFLYNDNLKLTFRVFHPSSNRSVAMKELPVDYQRNIHLLEQNIEAVKLHVERHWAIMLPS